jgi:hypothetical protein
MKRYHQPTFSLCVLLEKSRRQQDNKNRKPKQTIKKKAAIVVPTPTRMPLQKTP